MTIKVIYASKHDSTREVAEAIAAGMGSHHDVTVAEVSEVKSLRDVDAVVIGSAIYGGKWLAPAREFVDRLGEELKSRPVWLFSVGPLGDPPQPQEPGPEDTAETIDATGARAHKVFSGKLDYSALGRLHRIMAKAVHAPAGDFRDWAEIDGWAQSITIELSKELAHAG